MLIEAGCDYSLKNNEGKSAGQIMRVNHPGQVSEVQVIPLLLFTAYKTIKECSKYPLIAM